MGRNRVWAAARKGKKEKRKGGGPQGWARLGRGREERV
jgi:hypothetical protein